MNKLISLSLIVGVAPFCLADGLTNSVLSVANWRDNVWGMATADFNTKYMWRGTIMNDNLVWQPSGYLGYSQDDIGGVYFGVWTSMDLTSRKNDLGGVSRRYCGMQEFDYLLAITKSVCGVDFELQHWWYTYPNQNYDAYNDLVMSAKYDNPYVTIGGEVWWSYLNTDSMESCFWFDVFLLHDFSFFDDKLTITPRASLGFGDAAHQRNFVTDWKGGGADGNGAQLTDQTTTIRVAYALTKNLSIAGHVNYTWVPSKTLRDERWMSYGTDNRSQLVWGGIGITLSF